MQELGRETQAQFRPSFFPSAGLKLGVRHLLRPLTPRFTSPCNYICASAPCPSPPKDNVTICLFNCLSVTLLQALSGFWFLFPFVFIYLSRSEKWGVVWPPETGSLCLGWFHMDITPPTSTPNPPVLLWFLSKLRAYGFCLGAGG